MFTIQLEPIDPAPLSAALGHPSAGALVDFQGRVRDCNEGRRVRALEVEAFSELALHEGNAVLADVRARFDILDARCVHRTGLLAIGDVAVWVGVTARHRDAAFQACRAVIDAVKARVPIWKREHYVEGDSEWVTGAACASHGHTHDQAPGAARANPPSPGFLPEHGIVDVSELTPEVLAAMEVVDIRYASERDGNPGWVERLPNVLWTDVEAFTRLDPRRHYLLVCAAGVRSRKLAMHLRRAGFGHFYSLRQGITALAPLLDT